MGADPVAEMVGTGLAGTGHSVQPSSPLPSSGPNVGAAAMIRASAAAAAAASRRSVWSEQFTITWASEELS